MTILQKAPANWRAKRFSPPADCARQVRALRRHRSDRSRMLPATRAMAEMPSSRVSASASFLNLRCSLSWAWACWHWCSVTAASRPILATFAQAPAIVGACFTLASDLSRIFHALERRVRARGLQASPHAALPVFPSLCGVCSLRTAVEATLNWEGSLPRALRALEMLDADPRTDRAGAERRASFRPAEFRPNRQSIAPRSGNGLEMRRSARPDNLQAVHGAVTL